MRPEFTVKPIGIVRVSKTDEEVKNSWSGVEGFIEVFPEYAEGLEGLEGFSHIIVIAYLHKTSEEHRRVLRVRHRRLARLGVDPRLLPEVGVFATDSPHRPNPIAVTIVEVVELKENRIHVRGLDLFDGTPVLDIKPYTPSRVVPDVKTPKWYQKLQEVVTKTLGNRYEKPLEP